MPKGDQGENEEVFRLLEVIYTFATLQTLQEKKPSSKKEGKKVERQQKLTQMPHKLAYLDEQERDSEREPEVPPTSPRTRVK